MKEAIDRILEGNFDYEIGKIEFEESKIELTLNKEEDKEGTFRILCSASKNCEGKVYSSDSRMECLTCEFEGNEAEISYRFHGKHTEEGDVIKGTFGIVSNMGEYELPFVISVVRRFPESSEGEIKNLFLFANLAKSHWAEAVGLFYSENFENVIGSSDTDSLEAYRGLSANRKNEQNLEEFLVYINKKQRISYTVNFPILDISARMAADSPAVIEREIEITRKGWGYTAVNVECEGEFLFTEKEFLDDNDFLGSKCRLPVFIDQSACHRGVNSGKIYLFNSFFSVEIPVNIHIGSASGIRRLTNSRKKIIAELMRAYIDYRLKKIGKSIWLKEAGKYAERLVALDDEDIEARLFQIHVLITEERRSEAEWFMDHAEELFRKKKDYSAALEAYYYYLTTLVRPDAGHLKKAQTRIRELGSRNKKDWRCAWLLFYLEESYAEDPAKSFAYAKKLFEQKCTSPIVYVEVFLLIAANPALLRELGEFEIQILTFAIKNNVLTDPVMERVLELGSKVKDYSRLLFLLLSKADSGKKDPRFLKEICSLLIKGDKHGSAWLEWYRQGAAKQLRVTNIYEYYLMSAFPGENEEIPEPVLIYFSYQSQLDSERKAYLYRYIYERRGQIPELYAKYEDEIKKFVSSQLAKGVINRPLAVLYQDVLTEELIGESADQLSRFLFTEWVAVPDSRIKKLFLYYAKSRKPVEYPVQNGGCYAEVYGNGNCFVFEDAYGNRFLNSVEYTREKLMMPGRLLPVIKSLGVNNLYYDLYQYEKSENQGIRNRNFAEKLLRLLESGILRKEDVKKILLSLLEYYYDRDDLRDVSRCVSMADEAGADLKTRAELLKYILSLGNYELAYEWIKEYGPYFADTRSLLKLLDALIPRNEIGDPHLLYAAAYAFEAGRYDNCILRYLVHFYKGLSRQMRNIWKAAGSFEVDTYELSERILVQMMYTGAFVGDKTEIFKSYAACGAKEKVAKAFLLHCSYEYFVRERMTEGFVFEEMRRMFERKEEIPRLCKLAFLKYFAENKEEFSEKKAVAAESFLKEMTAEKIYLNFFREYAMFGEVLKCMEDRTVVEYRTVPGGRARIHFCLVRANSDAGDYYAEYMRDVYGGVCFKDFVLFFGEKIQYYIMEEADGEEKLTESGTLQMPDSPVDSFDSRFMLINDMAVSNAMGDYDTLDGLMEDFFRKEFLNGELFKLE